MSSSPPSVSVIVRCKNSASTIDEALAALFSQDFTDFDVLVVDSGSTDSTVDIVRRYPCRLIEIEAKAYIPGAVLNMAIEQTQGDLVVFLNSDCTPQSPQALRRLVEAFTDPEVQAAFARQIPRPDAATWVRREYAVSFPEAGPPPPWIMLSLPLAAMRRSIWREHPFYTDAWASEDAEWGHWAQAHGYTVKYLPQVVVMHSHNYTLRQIYGRHFVEGEADAFIYEDSVSLVRTAGMVLAGVAREWWDHARRRDFLGMGAVPVRQGVYRWAYYRGHKWGETRRARGDRDASTGQQIVLARHDD